MSSTACRKFTRRSSVGPLLFSALAIATALAAVAVTASPASAIIVRLPNGQAYSYQPLIPRSMERSLAATRHVAPGWKPAPRAALAKGAHPGVASSSANSRAASMVGRPGAHASTPGASTRSIYDSAFSNLDYSGGPVMHSNTNYVVEWNPSNYGGTPFQTDSSDPAADYVTGVTQFFKDLAGASGSNTNVDSVSAQYGDASGANAAYNSAYGGLIVDTHPLPGNACSADVPYCISDAQLQAELNAVLAANNLPRDLAHEYYLLTPPQVAICMPGNACSANQGANAVFCAYHQQSAAFAPYSTGFLYSAVPDVSGNPGCDLFAANGFDYLNSYADGVLSAVSHEHNESLTDPQPNNAWTDYQPCSGAGLPECNNPEWVGGEIGDKCGYQQQDDPNDIVLFDVFTGFFSVYNQVINGHDYWIQPEWSNQADPNGSVSGSDNFAHCLDHWSPNGSTAGAAFTQAAGAGTSVTFNAGASAATGGVAEYVWQFNDDVKPGDTSEQNTIETTSPTISHTFPQNGEYEVALTVMGHDGLSGVAAHTVIVTTPPTAAFQFSPQSPRASHAVSFDGSASLEPAPGATITSYGWSFGDGATASGAQVAHSFQRAGTYTVTLTVTNSSGQVGTAVHTVTVLPAGGHGGGCIVPPIIGVPLAKARGLVTAAGCRVGHVRRSGPRPHHRPGRHRNWGLVVTRESPHAGTAGTNGEAISLVVVWRAVPR